MLSGQPVSGKPSAGSSPTDEAGVRRGRHAASTRLSPSRTITLTDLQVRMLREALDCHTCEGGPLQGWLTDPYPTPEEWGELETLLEVETEPGWVK